jgi:hypothetical protein
LSTEDLPNPASDLDHDIPAAPVTPSREQQWRDIVENPPRSLPAAEIELEDDSVPKIEDLPEAGYTSLHRWILITALTMLLLLLGQGTAGDPSTLGNAHHILQR